MPWNPNMTILLYIFYPREQFFKKRTNTWLEKITIGHLKSNLVPNWPKVDQNLVQKGQNHIYRPREPNKTNFPPNLKTWSQIYIPNTKICLLKVHLDPRKGSKGSKIDLKWSKKSKRFWLVNMDLRWDNNFLTWRYKD